jgi:hypothetical protein
VKDEEYEATKNSLDRQVDRWKERLRLNDWTIRCRYYRSSEEYRTTAPEQQNGGAAACCVARWDYMLATIHFNVEAIFADDQEHDEIVAHEMAHVVLDELYRSGIAQDGNTPFEKTEWAGHNERVTSHFTSILLKAYEAVSP